MPLELGLLRLVSCPDSRGVVWLLDWFELPEGFALVVEHPGLCQDLWYSLAEWGFLAEPVARGLFWQVLQAVRHRTSRGILHRHIKAENVLVDLATGEAKLIDFGCGTILQDTFYTRMAGEPKAGAPPGSGGSSLCRQRGKREGAREGGKEWEFFFSRMQPSCFSLGQGLAVVELAGREGGSNIGLMGRACVHRNARVLPARVDPLRLLPWPASHHLVPGRPALWPGVWAPPFPHR